MPLLELIQKIHVLKAEISQLGEPTSYQIVSFAEWYRKNAFNKDALSTREARNYQEALTLMETAVRYKTSLNSDLLHALHKVVLKGIDDQHAGLFRLDQLLDSDVPQHMNDLWTVYHENNEQGDLVKIARFHFVFMKIQPYISGNGLIIHLMTNIMLQRCGYPLQIIPFERKNEYVSNLHPSKIFSDFYTFFLSVQCQSMKDYLRILIS